jgi:hypothetical protein
MKAPDYCAKHRYRHNVTVPRHLVELELSGVSDDVWAHLSEANRVRLNAIRAMIEDRRNYVGVNYTLLAERSLNDKEYAGRVNMYVECPQSRGLLFALRKNKTIDEILATKTPEFYCQWINLPKTFTELDNIIDNLATG